MLVASNADPSLLVRVPTDNRVNVDNVLDENLQNVVAEWGRISPSHAADGAGCGVAGTGPVASQHSYVVALSSENGDVPQCDNGNVTQDLPKIPIDARVSQLQIVGGLIVGCLVTPQSAVVVQNAPQPGSDVSMNTGTGVVVQGKDGDKNETVPVFRPCDGAGSSSGGPNKSPLAVEGFVFKAGGSGSGLVPKHAGSIAKGPKAAGRVHQRARPVLSRGSGAGFAAGPAPNRPNPPNTRPINPGAAVPEVVPAGPPEGAKVVLPRAPVATQIPVVNPELFISPRVTRSKTRVKARNDSPPKESSPKACVNVSAPLSDVVGSEDMVFSPSKNGKGLKGVQKDKTIISQIPVVSPNSFDALNIMGGGGGSSGSRDADIVDVQMGDLVPSSTENANQDNEEGVWQHVTRKGHSNVRGGAISSSVSPCG
ncbi:hypothetical protein LIER_06372 [Lithospermum erythrorhizon]|uniref:Uncharacterized protein n=1 Tax=Lithospermum erythrorhizon TaxID=34254 RepID=A0AAV3P448_LITER